MDDDKSKDITELTHDCVQILEAYKQRFGNFENFISFIEQNEIVKELAGGREVVMDIFTQLLKKIYDIENEVEETK